jgi:CBS domain containing-hemolysin-like protein
LSSIVLGIYGEQQIAPYIAPLIAKIPFLGSSSPAGEHLAAAGIAATLVLLVLTTLQVVMGELVPKSLAMQFPERIALLTALPMKWSAEYILRPLIIVLNGSGTFALKLLGANGGGGHSHVHSPEEILILVKESRQGGLLDADEERFLENVFRSGRTKAVEIAVPRTRIVAAALGDPVHEVLRLAADSAYSRIPVYKDDIDQIVGFVHLRDLFVLSRSEENEGLSSILRPVPFVPETLSTAEVWNRMDDTNSYLVIVFDEYGGTSGLITREDLVEELFGELQDEFDSEESPFLSLGDGLYSARGDVTVATANQVLGIQLPLDGAHTLGGLLMKRLGQIPKKGDSVAIEGTRLKVETVSGRSVSHVTITLPTNTSGEEDTSSP